MFTEWTMEIVAEGHRGRLLKTLDDVVKAILEC